MFPENGEVIIKIPRSLTKDIVKVTEQLDKYSEGEIPEEWKKWDSFIVHLDNHLYTPLVIWKERKEEIKSIPVKLNKGEKKFVNNLREFLNRNKNLFGSTDIFLLRNLSRRGIGFFISSGFYPDFIIWIKNRNKQHMIFVDPKGIRNLGNFNDDKIQLCVSYIKEIESQISKRLRREKKPISLVLDAFIISTSSYDDIKITFREDKYTKDEFERHNILFMEDEAYIKKIFERVGCC